MILLLRIDEEADLVAADIRILVQAGEECEEVHLHCDLSGLEGIEPFGHVGVAHAGRGAALVQRLVEFECLDRFRRVDEALHLIGLVRIVVLEAPVVERVRHAHGDAFGAALGVDIGPIDLLAVDLPALEKLGDFLQLIPGLRRR